MYMPRKIVNNLRMPLKAVKKCKIYRSGMQRVFSKCNNYASLPWIPVYGSLKNIRIALPLAIIWEDLVLRTARQVVRSYHKWTSFRRWVVFVSIGNYERNFLENLIIVDEPFAELLGEDNLYSKCPMHEKDSFLSVSHHQVFITENLSLAVKSAVPQASRVFNIIRPLSSLITNPKTIRVSCYL